MESPRSREGEIAVSQPKQFSQIALENGVFETKVTRKFTLRKPYQRQNPGIVKAVIPGVVAEIIAKKGTPVKKGDTMMTIEAMKMLNRITAPVHGTVKAVHASAGDKVAKGQVLMEIESTDLLVAEGGRRNGRSLF
jgi:biotin carboxyl carrier protein